MFKRLLVRIPVPNTGSFFKLCLKRPKINKKRMGMAHWKMYSNYIIDLVIKRRTQQDEQRGFWWQKMSKRDLTFSRAQLVFLLCMTLWYVFRETERESERNDIIAAQKACMREQRSLFNKEKHSRKKSKYCNLTVCECECMGGCECERHALAVQYANMANTKSECNQCLLLNKSAKSIR